MPKRRPYKALSSILFRPSVAPFQMAVQDGDLPSARIADDKELIHLAQTLAIADMHCMAMIAYGAYEIRGGLGDFHSEPYVKLTDCPDPWHEHSSRHSAIAINKMQGWAHSIQAYAEGTTLAEWLSRLRRPFPGETLSNPACHEIIGVRDDDWAREWSSVIQQIVSDYNGIRYGKRPFHKHYLEDDSYNRMWDQLLKAATRLEGPSPRRSTREVIDCMEVLKGATNTVGDALERLMVEKIRDIDRPILQTIKHRALILQGVQLEMHKRFCSYSSSSRSPWLDHIMSPKWEQREKRIVSALQFNSELSPMITKNQPKTPRAVSEALAMDVVSTHRSGQLIPWLSKADMKISPTHLHAITGFTVLIAAIPAMIGWGQSESGPGSTEDADFWWLLTGMAFQLQNLSLFAARLPLSSSTKPTIGRPWLHAYVWVGILSTISAFPLYLWVSVRYSSAAAFLGSVDAALLHVQVTLATSFAITPETKPKAD